MKILFTQLRRTALTGLALAASLGVSQAATFLSGSYTNNFDIGTNTANFTGSGSVAGWLYWYGQGYGNNPMTNQIDQDYQGNASSGSLQVIAYLSGGNQDVFFAGFDNQYTYDDSVQANLLLYSNITFYIKMAAGTPPRQNNGTNIDFGTIGVGFSPPGSIGWAYTQLGQPTIPLAASNSFVKLAVPINYSLPNVNDAAAIVFQMQSYGGYPQFTITNYIDNLQLNVNPGPPPPPPTLSAPVAAIPGLNAIASSSIAQFNRSQAATVNNTGYSFVGQPSVTYSWTISSFPTGTGGNYQQHFFLVGPYAPGPFDQAADYNLPDVLWFTVQQSDAGVATMNFRLKTNEQSGNAMLFNTNPTNTNGWPVEPISALTNANGAIGTWSVTIANSTNITMSGPGGLSTNFNITADQAALFADPGVTMILGGQPNNLNGAGKSVVYSSFSVTGCATPFTDNFLADSTLNTTIWKNLSNDTNGLYLVPGNAAYWIPWTLPDIGFSLQEKASLNAAGGWTLPTTPILRVNGHDEALLTTAQLPSASQGYFQLIQFQASQLQVLLGGQTNAPGTLTGYTGTATNISLGGDSGFVNVTINAVDPTFHIVPGVTDTIILTSSADPNATEPLPAPLVNGTLTTAVQMITTGTFTITATDQSPSPLTSGTSTSVTITP